MNLELQTEIASSDVRPRTGWPKITVIHKNQVSLGIKVAAGSDARTLFQGRGPLDAEAASGAYDAIALNHLRDGKPSVAQVGTTRARVLEPEVGLPVMVKVDGKRLMGANVLVSRRVDNPPLGRLYQRKYYDSRRARGKSVHVELPTDGLREVTGCFSSPGRAFHGDLRRWFIIRPFG